MKNKRYELIIELLLLEEASFTEIEKYLLKKDKTIKITRRTFQRDINDIKDNYGIIIKADRKQQIYYLEKNTNKSKEAIQKYNILTLQNSDKKYNFIKKEKHNLQGAEFIHEIIYAIKNKLKIKINYIEYWKIERENFELEPLAFKEFKRRWYLIAKDTKQGIKKLIKNFELSRITELQLTKDKFENKKFNIDEHFNDYFGIRTDDDPFEDEIILSLEPLHAKYLIAVPLHHSQKILKETLYNNESIFTS